MCPRAASACCSHLISLLAQSSPHSTHHLVFTPVKSPNNDFSSTVHSIYGPVLVALHLLTCYPDGGSSHDQRYFHRAKPCRCQNPLRCRCQRYCRLLVLYLQDSISCVHAGKLSQINAMARRLNAQCVIHTGDFGFYDDDSLDRINERSHPIPKLLPPITHS